MTDSASDDWEGALERARAHAPFLARALDKRPELAELLSQGRGEDALASAQASGEGHDTGIALRRQRLGLALTLAIGDLAGAFDLETVTGQLSAFADEALSQAILAAITRRVDDADATGFYALALGKHGARELNYSSDIDPILLYQPERLARRERDEPGEAAQRYAREIVQLLSQNTAEGYVFRVDLRLRPASEVSPLAIPENAALDPLRKQRAAVGAGGVPPRAGILGRHRCRRGISGRYRPVHLAPQSRLRGNRGNRRPDPADQGQA